VLGSATATSLVSSGTAASSFTVTSGTAVPLTITNVGTGNSFVVEDTTSPDASPFIVDALGRVIQGYTTAILTADDYNGTNRTAWGYQGNNSNAAGALFTTWNTSATVGAGISLSRSRSATVGTQAIVSSGDSLGGIGFTGDDGTNFIVAASIAAEVDGTPGVNDMPGRLIFSTTADGAATSTERMRIDNAGLTSLTGTFSVTGVSTLTGGAVVQGMTVGRGNGSGTTNTTVGLIALASNTSGDNNVAVGFQALLSNTTGVSNTALGSNALVNNLDGSNNIAVGLSALVNNTNGNYNTAAGYLALSGNNGSNNTAFGNTALSANTTGTSNTAVGSGSGSGITTGSYNVIIGTYGGYSAPISQTGSNWIILSDGASNVRQAIDSAGNAQFLSGAVVVYAPAPASFSALATLTNANLQTQLIVTTGTTFTLTMPTGSDLDTLISWSGDDLGYDFSVINTASGTITVAGNTGVTIVGRATVLTVVTARFRIRRTAASTYILYRIA
tara:strand:- start:98 stop:1603 length:1506 start_codon:yes stop_codon:yes gene_type:complete